MALLDALSDLAKKGEALAKDVAGKAGEFVDEKKLDLKIAEKTNEIKKVQQEIGARYFAKMVAGEVNDLELNEMCGKISLLLNDIDQLNDDAAAKKAAAEVVDEQ